MAVTIAEGAFRIEVLNAAGTVKYGAIMTATTVTRTRKLNEAGAVSFSFPASDPAGALVQFGRRYHVYGRGGEDLGEYLHRDYDTTTGDTPLTTVRADATLKLLAQRSAKFNRAVSNVRATLAAQAIVNAVNETDPYLGAPANVWSCVPYDPSNELGDVTLEIQGQTVLESLNALRQLARANFRQVGTYAIEFGTFANVTMSVYGQVKYGEAKYLGDVAGGVIRYATNAESLTRDLESSSAVIITGCRVVQESNRVTNRVIVLGSGDGLNQLTMQETYDDYAAHKPDDSTSAYVVKRAVNPDSEGKVWYIKVTNPGSGYTSDPTVTISGGGGVGATARVVRDATSFTVIAVSVTAQGTGYTSPPNVVISGGGGVGATAEAYISTYYYYLEDTDSIDAYGLYEAVIAKSDIRPLTNSDAQIRYASDALYYVGVAFLEKNKGPQTVYSVDVLNFPSTANVGETLRFRYKGLASFGGDLTKWLDVDAQAAILDIEEAWTDGEPQVRLLISTNGERNTDDIDVVLGVQRDVSGLKVRVQPYPSREVVNVEREIDATHPFEFELLVEDDVLYMISARLQFVTRPFRSVVNPNLKDSGVTIGNGGRTTEFMYMRDGSGNMIEVPSPGALLLTEPPDASGNVGRVNHYHGFPIIGGFNSTGASTAGVPDGWYITWGGGNLNVGSAYGINNPPPWGGQYFTFGEGSGRGYSALTEHYHRYYLRQHEHVLPSLALTGSIDYGIYDDPGDASATNTPTGVAVYLDGQLVGANFPDGNGQTRTLDITAALQNAPGGLRKTHSVRFICASGRGLIEATVRLYVALQATVKTVNFGGQ